jgi:CrcB protein
MGYGPLAMAIRGNPDRHGELPLDPDTADAPFALALRPTAIALVALGGFAGTIARYGLARAEPTRTGSWPWGTFIANIVGAFVLGALLELLARSGPDQGWRQRARLLLGTGFCGALTTFSTLAVEGDLLIRAHDAGRASAYLAASLGAGLLATVIGIAAAAAAHRRRRPGGVTP